MIHCQDNVRDYLSKSGVALDVCEKVLHLLFGADSVAVSNCAAVFEDRRTAMLQCVRQCCPSIDNYISSHILPKILITEQLQDSLEGTMAWSTQMDE